MPENWDIYRCLVDDHPTAIYVDLGVGDKAPQSKRPCLLRVIYRLQTPNAEGLSDAAEAETLFEIEDVLFTAVSRQLRARYVGRITTQGGREHFYYAVSAAEFEPALDQVQAQFPDYNFEQTAQADPDWEVYFDLLYPTDLDLQTINTRRQVEALIRDGVDVLQARDVDHWLYFPSTTARQRFIDQVSGTGFLWKEFLDEDPAAEFPHGLVLARRDQVDLTYIEGLVTDLFLRAQNCGGVYSGWGKAIGV